KEVVIKVDNVSKMYRLGQFGTGSFRNDFKRWLYALKGKEDPFAKIEANDRTKKSTGQYVWALNDISFEISKGDTIGFIGKNGSGKSTLLKLLSRITTPTKGSIKSKGRIASLLEVGTGFHPDLTGRENVYLNGAILGMTKTEISAKFDEIVDFSGVEKYIDTPVKRYSSGMYVRLAFAVAAFLEPEILIVDEVLAVGDSEFQKKCLGRMRDVSTNDGRTVLFVSHNMSAIQALCNKSVFLEFGQLISMGATHQVIEQYLSSYWNANTYTEWPEESAPGDSSGRLLSVALLNKDYQPVTTSFLEDEIYIEYTYKCLVDNIKLSFSIEIVTDRDEILFSSPSLADDEWSGKVHSIGTYKAYCLLPAHFFNEATYRLNILFLRNFVDVIADVHDVITIQKFDSGLYRRDFIGEWRGIARPLISWNTIKQ
ncbi:MAG: ATP-binding cassette domain-containing protein, partial [Chitinophagia bacterium]|nr:ATP-binding cassette domain-containing protein [Chitinophagia bacterium]